MPDETAPRRAPGWPGIPARWTSSAKSGLGTALNGTSRVWFTLSHGILNEIYFPRIDHACTRDCGFIVTGAHGFFSEEKRQTRAEIEPVSAGVPAYLIRNTCLDGHYRIEKEIFADPRRPVVWQRVRFVPLEGTLDDYRLFVLLAPHLGNQGAGNTAWVGEYKGRPILFAARDVAGGATAFALSLALASSAPWRARSVGFAGTSDGWQQLSRDGELRECYSDAPNGNVAMVGEIDLRACRGAFDLTLGFDTTGNEAAQMACWSLMDGFDAPRREYIAGWQRWLDRLTLPAGQNPRRRRLVHTSAMVLRAHDGKPRSGGLIASLSIPWGSSKGDGDLGGYHLIWPRDLVEAAGGLLAIGAKASARGVLDYLRVAQEADGHWPQNMWLDGTPYWNGIQMDETALPILLVDLVKREAAITAEEADACWPMVRRAAGFIVRNGPVSQQDRWEEDPGYSPFTIGAEIAALLAAAELARLNGEESIADYLTTTADAWHENLDRWMYATGTELARRLGVEGYYVRISPPEPDSAASPMSGFVPIKNRPPAEASAEACLMVSPDALALVRFGLRAADDPRMVNTVTVIDALLKVETANGPSWHRYNEDGYGEHEDGRPFDGTGIGRAWPLLTGERAHYELAAGRRDEAEKLLASMEAFAGDSDLMPEQIWDAPDIPARELFNGQASGSARPLVWAHAEYVKMCRSLEAGRIFDQPVQTVRRYLSGATLPKPPNIWRFNHKIRSAETGRAIRLETCAPAIVHWGIGDWTNVQDVRTRDTGLDMHIADLPTASLERGMRVVFTFYWPEADRWEGVDFSIEMRAAGPAATG